MFDVVELVFLRQGSRIMQNRVLKTGNIRQQESMHNNTVDGVMRKEREIWG